MLLPSQSMYIGSVDVQHDWVSKRTWTLWESASTQHWDDARNVSDHDFIRTCIRSQPLMTMRYAEAEETCLSSQHLRICRGDIPGKDTAFHH